MVVMDNLNGRTYFDGFVLELMVSTVDEKMFNDKSSYLTRFVIT